ncbi:hypothetical protein [Enterocloster citroniae]|uniref:hypothetical protein n=1 Tax=Enterocloster citroniae TaxID=358743 RepID=UPI0034A19CE4
MGLLSRMSRAATALSKYYYPFTWRNKPSIESPINEVHLNHIEDGINEMDNRILILAQDKADASDMANVFVDFEMDDTTGVMTFTRFDGSKVEHDSAAEKIALNCYLEDDNFVLELADGTKQKVSLSKFIDTYTFSSSDTIKMTVNGKNISADIPDGKITLAKLEPTVLSTIRQYTLDAQTAKGISEQAAGTAQGWAIGGTGFEDNNAKHYASRSQRYAVGGVEDGDTEDNAKYYFQQAQAAAEQATEVVGFDGTAATVSAIDTHGVAVRSASGIGRVSIDDAGDDPILNLNLAGKSEQSSLTGAQLFDISKLIRTHNEVEFSMEENGGVLVTGNTLQNAANSAVVPVTLSPGAYYISGSTPIGESKIFVRIKLWHGDSSSVVSDASFSVDGTETKIECFIQLYQGLSDFKAVVYPMLNAGETALPWEPYTGGKPSPSPEYPQPIISTGTVTTGVQMLDFRNGKSGTVGGITYTNVGDGTYKRTGTVTSSSGAVWFLGGYNITPNADGSNVIVTLKKGVEYIAKDCWLFWFSDNTAFSCEEGKPFTPESDIKITGVRNPWQIEGSTYNDVIRPMLVEGDTVIWEPYTGGKPSPSEEYPQPLDVRVTGANLFDANAIKTTSSNGISFVNNNDGSVTVKGTSLDSADTYGVKVDLQPGIYHTSGGQGNVKIMVRVKDNGETKYYSNHEFTVSTDSYVEIYIHVDSGKTVDTTIWPMLNAGSTALPWQPYQSKAATIQLTAPLYGIGDVQDRIMCKDGIWGMERQFIPLTFDGSDPWSAVKITGTEKWRYVNRNYQDVIKAEKNSNAPINILCNRLKAGSSSETYDQKERISSSTLSQIYIYLDDFSSGDVAAFKTYLSTHPINAIFERATPTWEPLPAATQSALNALTTFTGTTHITITAGGPEPDVAVEYFGQPGDKVTVQDMCDSFAAPAFDDSGVVPGISGFGDFLNRLTSGVRFPSFFRDLKAGLKFVLHTGQLVNNGLCNEPGKYPLDAAYGRTLLEMIGNTADLPGGAADIVSAIVTQNSNLGDGRFRVLLRNASTEDKENAASLKITLADFDGIAQVWYYIVMVTNGLDGIIIGELSTTGNYGGQLFISDAGIKYRKLSSGTYGAWNKLITNADFLTKIVSLNQVTVPANAGITGSTTNISGQIPSGYKLLDAREVGSGNNGCYIYYFKVDGTNITLQLRNVTNTEIKTSPAAQLLLIPK